MQTVWRFCFVLCFCCYGYNIIYIATLLLLQYNFFICLYWNHKFYLFNICFYLNITYKYVNAHIQKNVLFIYINTPLRDILWLRNQCPNYKLLLISRYLGIRNCFLNNIFYIGIYKIWRNPILYKVIFNILSDCINI